MARTAHLGHKLRHGFVLRDGAGREVVAELNCSVALPMTMGWSMRLADVRWLRAEW